MGIERTSHLNPPSPCACPPALGRRRELEGGVHCAPSPRPSPSRGEGVSDDEGALMAAFRALLPAASLFVPMLFAKTPDTPRVQNNFSELFERIDGGEVPGEVWEKFKFKSGTERFNAAIAIIDHLLEEGRPASAFVFYADRAIRNYETDEELSKAGERAARAMLEKAAEMEMYHDPRKREIYGSLADFLTMAMFIEGDNAVGIRGRDKYLSKNLRALLGFAFYQSARDVHRSVKQLYQPIEQEEPYKELPADVRASLEKEAITKRVMVQHDTIVSYIKRALELTINDRSEIASKFLRKAFDLLENMPDSDVQDHTRRLLLDGWHDIMTRQGYGDTFVSRLVTVISAGRENFFENATILTQKQTDEEATRGEHSVLKAWAMDTLAGLFGWADLQHAKDAYAKMFYFLEQVPDKEGLDRLPDIFAETRGDIQKAILLDAITSTKNARIMCKFIDDIKGRTDGMSALVQTNGEKPPELDSGAVEAKIKKLGRIAEKIARAETKRRARERKL